MAATDAQIREAFFEYLFSNVEGYICICTQVGANKETFRQSFFTWPSDKKKMHSFIGTESASKHVWFGVNILSAPQRVKMHCKKHNLLWGDLDDCDPHKMEPKPQCIIESSPGRWQAIWRLDQIIDPYLAETYSKKMAYKYSENGADKSGWDLTQILRVPFTRNFKPEYVGAPQVKLRSAAKELCPAEIFELLKVEIPTGDDPLAVDMPAENTLPSWKEVCYAYRNHLTSTAFQQLFDSDPPEGADWSNLLWRLVNICIEVGMSKEETFSVTLAAKCNKYRRDNRPIRHLWREIVKADNQQRRLTAIFKHHAPLVMPMIITDKQIAGLDPTFIDKYRDWGSSATDAVIDFHNIGAFMLLSMLTSASVRLKASQGEITPNIWALVLGDSTITRKTTAMNMAMQFVLDIDRDLVLASAGSMEGILTGLSARPNMVSIFYKDEVQGFFNELNKKDYLAGMSDTLANLYDVPAYYPRRLRKEVIELVKPIFIFFGGGIKDRFYNAVDEEMITQGFLPRFIIVSGDGDLSKLKPMGPAMNTQMEARNSIRNDVANLYEMYNTQSIQKIGSQDVLMPPEIEAVLTDKAWEAYNAMAGIMLKAANESPMQSLAMPSFERLSRSLLKMAILLAASRQAPADNKISVAPQDIYGAAKYVQQWGMHTVDLITNHGRNVAQRTIEKIIRYVRQHPGIARSIVSKNHQLSKKEMDDVLGTLVDRGEIRIEKQGTGFLIWPV